MKFEFKHVMIFIICLIFLPLILRVAIVGIVLAALLIGLFVIYKVAEYFFNKFTLKVERNDMQ